MAMLFSASARSHSLLPTPHSSLLHRPKPSSRVPLLSTGAKSRDNGACPGKVSARKRDLCEAVDETEMAGAEETGELTESETLLYSFTPLPLLLFAALPGAGAVRSVFGPFVELVKSWNLPDWLVHWGHPGNMAVVLFAMGGYGTYLGFRIKYSDDVEEKAKAKDLHPKLLGGMFFFFALGATGGITSLLTSDKPIFESPHAVTGFIGLSLLTIQTILPTLFEGNPGLRNVHGILGSGIMTLFLIHAAFGLQLGLSY
ncbi:uncharacterized protein LOC116208535 isoform X1 [Punica granatum]|uniref:Uncharacterized protein LOC116208535 isoform X1 n=1 Tax=Punica granatum TaxID=22663 RepID=A0A6P8DKL3_PUNGR|nr:uncharacterized protein LOC116208535 isoform X1 [Punica granatum]